MAAGIACWRPSRSSDVVLAALWRRVLGGRSVEGLGNGGRRRKGEGGVIVFMVSRGEMKA